MIKKTLLITLLLSTFGLFACTTESNPTDAKNQFTPSPTQVVLKTATAIVQVPTAVESEFAKTSLDNQTQQVLIDAINDEYKAKALYSAVIAKFGESNPFLNIRDSEQTHIDELKTLFNQYNLTIPEDNWSVKVEAPDTREAACSFAVQAEKDNMAMYERFLGFVKAEDIRVVFTFLHDASRDKHLPAFERCGSGSGGGNGTGKGRNL